MNEKRTILWADPFTAPSDGSVPLPDDAIKNTTVNISGVDGFGSWGYAYTNFTQTAPIAVLGHSGLTMGGCNSADDNLYYDPADQ